MPTPLGQRIATLRRARNLAQEELAQAAGLSASMLRKIEQGSRHPSDSTLHDLAAALRTTTDHLLEGPGHTDSRVHQAVPAIRAAITTAHDPDDGPTRPLPELAQAVDAVVRQRLNSQYAQLADSIAPLIAELQRATHHHAGAAQRQAARLLAAAYRSADAAAYKYGHADLSGRLVELLRQTAERTDDPAWPLAAAYVRTEDFFAARILPAGLRALQRAIDAAPAATTLQIRAAIAALHMRAAVVAARMRDHDTAHLHLADAGRVAVDIPEGVYHGTAVGPDSLHIHELAVACELGEPAGLRQAANTATCWAPPRGLPSERRSHYYIDLARAQMQLGRREHAFESLQVARRIAPQHVREHGQVRTELATLMRLSRGRNDQLLAFCRWASVV